MDESLYKTILLVMLFLFFLVRSLFMRWSGLGDSSYVKRLRENLLVALNWTGMVFLPLIYVFSTWLDRFSLGFPSFLRFFGVFLYLAALVLMFWSHRSLGGNWSMVLRLHRNHSLITSGPYRFIRHPMYLAFYLIVFAQLLVSSNWVVGFYGVSAWSLLYFIRIPSEEKMLKEKFGDEYNKYKEKTGRILPHL